MVTFGGCYQTIEVIQFFVVDLYIFDILEIVEFFWLAFAGNFDS